MLLLASACSSDDPSGTGIPASPGPSGTDDTGSGAPATGSGMDDVGSAGGSASPSVPGGDPDTPGTSGSDDSADTPSGTDTGEATPEPGTGTPEPDTDTMDGADATDGSEPGDDGDATGGTDGMDDTGTPPSSTPTLPHVDSTDGPGPFDSVVKVRDTPPGGWLVYPEDIGRDGIKHPLFLFGPGGGTTPQTYEDSGMHWDRYGSYGFVIYVLPRSTGDGSAMKAGLDWLFEQNDDPDSPLYQHLDTSKVCAAGHSMGSVTTFDFMPDDRVTTTIHISGGSFDGQGPSNLSDPTMFLCGQDSAADLAVPQCDGDFMNSDVPTFYTKIQGSDHLTSGRLGWPAIIAWMLWHLAGHEEQWKPEFLEPDGLFHMGMYNSQIKNW